MLQQLGTVLADNALFAGILFHQVISRYNERRNKLPLVGNDSYLVDVAVYNHTRLQSLRRDVFPVRGLEQVLDTFGQIQGTSLQPSGITRMEPSVLVYGSSRRYRFLVVTLGNGLATEQYFVIFTDLHLQVGHHFAHRADDIIHRREAGNRSGRLCQSVTHYHVDAHRVDKLTHFIRHSCSSSRKERAILNTDGLLQQGIDRLFVEFILEMQHQGRILPLTHVLQVVFPAHLDGIENHGFPHPRLLGNALLHALIDFLPKTRNTAHHRRTHLLNGHLYILRMQVDANLHTTLNANIRPAPFKHMRQRQETQ